MLMMYAQTRNPSRLCMLGARVFTRGYAAAEFSWRSFSCAAFFFLLRNHYAQRKNGNGKKAERDFHEVSRQMESRFYESRFLPNCCLIRVFRVATVIELFVWLLNFGRGNRCQRETRIHFAILRI